MDRTELEQVLIGDSAHTPPARILDGLESDLAHRIITGAPHTIYQELWHIAFWLEMTLDWVRDEPTPYPKHASDGFPGESATAGESWDQLKERFFRGNLEAAAAARDESRLEHPVRCPSPPGMPERIMTVREQLESLGAHNAYHFGRIVLMRQMLGAWPPSAGGFSW